MKKLLALLMVIVLSISLCACGGESDSESATEATPTREEMLAQAQEVTLGEISAAIKENEVRAETLYDGKIVKINNFQVQEINSYTDKATIEWTYLGASVMLVSANITKEDAAMLSTGDLVTVVGEFDLSNSAFPKINNAFVVK